MASEGVGADVRHRRQWSFLAAVGMSVALAVTGCGNATETTAGVRTAPPQEALAVVTQGGAVVLDVRTPEEYAAGHVAGARNLPLENDFETAVARLPRDGTYVLYCQSGNRSGQAAEIMERLDFADVLDAGGLPALAAAGADVVTG